jgi:hypothetical protein
VGPWPVYAGTSLLAKVNLYSGVTINRALIALPRFSPRSTVVTLKVLSSGGVVRIDGLVTSRV